MSLLKKGSTELRNLVKDAVSVVIENFQEKGSELKDEVTASIEGALEGINIKDTQLLLKLRENSSGSKLN